MGLVGSAPGGMMRDGVLWLLENAIRSGWWCQTTLSLTQTRQRMLNLTLLVNIGRWARHTHTHIYIYTYIYICIIYIYIWIFIHINYNHCLSKKHIFSSAYVWICSSFCACKKLRLWWCGLCTAAAHKSHPAILCGFGYLGCMGYCECMMSGIRHWFRRRRAKVLHDRRLHRWHKFLAWMG